MYDLLKASQELPLSMARSPLPDVPLTPHQQEPLGVSLCPFGDCKAVSHLSCLATDFLSSDHPQSSGLLPRGGNCRSCRSYVLWGDVIRGCYRRHQGGKVLQLEESDREEGTVEDGAQADPTEDLIPAKPPHVRIMEDEVVKRSRGRPPKKRITSDVGIKRAAVVAGKDSEDENFDIGGFTDLDDSDSEMELRPPKPTLAKQRK